MKIKETMRVLVASMLLSSCLLFWGCQEEKIVDVEEINEFKSLDIRVAHWHNFKIGNRKVANMVGKYRKQNQAFRNTESSEYGFFIEEEQVQIIEHDDYTTYTFMVIRDEDQEGVLENYMYKEYTDGSYQQFLLRYYYTVNDEGEIVYSADSMGIETINDEGLIVQDNSAGRNDHCSPHFERVEDGQTCTIYENCTGPGQHEMGDGICGCTGYNGCFPAGMVCEQNFTYVFYDCGGGQLNDPIDPGDPNTPPDGGGSLGGGSATDDGGTTSTPFNVDIRLGEFVESLDELELEWWNDSRNHELREIIKNFLQLNDFSERAYTWAEGQIELELKAGQYNWTSSSGKVAGLEYTHVDQRGSAGAYFKLTDGSIVFSVGSEQILTTAGDLTDKYRDTSNIDHNEKFYYIKIPGYDWAEMLFNPDNLADSLRLMLELGTYELGVVFGRYVFPVEDIKIMITGTDFDGVDASRWAAAGFFALGIIPGGKAFRILDDVADAVTIAIRLKGGSQIVDLAATGLKIAEDSAAGVIRLLDNLGNEIARVVDGILTFFYSGYGGNIVTTANKTTTVIGKYIDNVNGGGTKDIIESGLSKSGRNDGGINALSETIDPDWSDQEIWDNVNEPWLREAAENEDIIRAVSDPTIPSNIYKPNGELSFFGREHELLTKPVSEGGLGYVYNSSTFTYIK